MKKIISLIALGLAAACSAFANYTLYPDTPQTLDAVFVQQDIYSPTDCFYTIRLTTHHTPTNAETMAVVFEISYDGLNDWTELGRVELETTGDVPTGTDVTTVHTSMLAVTIPQYFYARLRTVGTGSAPTATFVKGFEIAR